MFPLIRQTDAIGVLPLRHPEDLRIGDIALFQWPSGMVAHRIVGKFRKDNTTYFYEKGDAAVLPKPIAGELIIGKVVKIYRPARTINLTSRFWLIANRSAGYYWHCLYAGFELTRILKNQLFGVKKYPRINAAYRTVYRFLSALPAMLFRHKQP